MKRTLGLAGIATVCAFGRTASADSFGVVTEAVDDYRQCNGPSLSNSIANVTGFRNGLLNASGSIFQSGANWQNSWVYASDFRDPERVTSDADDTHNFDPYGASISYYTGHGFCPNTGNADNQPCTTAADCTNPPPGAQMPSFCRIWNGNPAGSGNCMYHAYDRSLAIGNCSENPSLGGAVNYSTGNVVFGESADSGGWAGAGTNGGVNFVVLDASCALMGWRESEAFSIYGGVHAVAFTNTYTGDVANVGDRGGAFANYYAVNPAGSVSYAWVQSMAQVSPAGGACTTVHLPGPQQQLSSGGHGYNGCGMNEVVALDTTAEGAQGKILEPWPLITQDFRDAQGNGYWNEVYQCNWDCNNDPGRM